MEVPLHLYRVFGVCLLRLHCVCIGCYRFHCVLTETVRSCHGDHCAPAALLLRLQGEDTAIPLRCEQSQQNCIKAACSLPPSLCVQLHHGCWTPASRAIPGLYAGPAGRWRYKRCASHSETKAWEGRKAKEHLVRQWLDVARRLQYGHYHRLMCEFRYEDPARYVNFLLVPPEMFDKHLDRSGPLIIEKPSNQVWSWLWQCATWIPGTGTPAWSSTLECLTIPCLCVFATCARPSSRSSSTSASSVLPPKQNGGSFLRHLDEDGTFIMHMPRLMGNM